MKISWLSIFILMLLSGLSCTTLSHDQCKERGQSQCMKNGPYQCAEKKELVDLCARFLDHYCQGRFDETERMFAPHAVIAIDRVDKKTQSILTARQFLTKSRTNWDEGTRFIERLEGDPIVLRDNNMVCVWAPYRIEMESGNAEGIDAFQWIRLEGDWRLVSLCYTNRKVR